MISAQTPSAFVATESRFTLFGIMLLGHDLFRKPLHTFRDHALPPPLQPTHPQLAVSSAIFRDGKVLLVRRARSPAKGFYSLPGGRVEFGETLRAALHREVGEETALNIEIIGLAAWREVVPGSAGGGHYLIMSFAARWISGEVVLNEELDEYVWLAPDALGGLKITGGLQEVIQSALLLVESGSDH
jgi:ADP-ribose pyrophosphatase YjhB (NUDIX family)